MRRCVTAAIAAVVVWLGFDLVPASAQRALTPVTDAMLRNPDPADWLMWRRTLNGWGYNPLDQIDRSNVARLQLIWSRPLGPGLQEGTPLVHDGVMSMPNPADFIQAINAATGDLLWETPIVDFRKNAAQEHPARLSRTARSFPRGAVSRRKVPKPAS